MNRHVKRGVVLLVMVLAIVALVSATLGRELLAGRQPTLGSFALVHFAGYLFFLVMPVEALVPYYLSEGAVGVILIPVAVITATGAHLIDYGIGVVVSDRIIDTIIGRRRFERAGRVIDRWGRWAILAFSFLPLSSPSLLLAAGIARFRLDVALLFSVAGLTAKYLILVFVFDEWVW